MGQAWQESLESHTGESKSQMLVIKVLNTVFFTLGLLVSCFWHISFQLLVIEPMEHFWASE